MTWLQKMYLKLIKDVPANLDACETCRVVSCPQSEWETCEKRLAIKALREREAKDS